MIRYLEKLNLKPHEIRIVVAIAMVVFVLLNFWFVFPLFGEWSKTQRAIRLATGDWITYQEEIGRVKGPTGYEQRLRELEDTGADILPEEYAVQLIRTVQSTLSANGIVPRSVQASGRGAQTASPTDVFEEQSVNVTFDNAEEKALVNFLHEISTGKSLIRVRDMNVKPEATNTKLSGTLTLTASFQKNSLTKKPATTAANK